MEILTAVVYGLMFLISFGLAARTIIGNWNLIKAGQPEELDIPGSVRLKNIFIYVLLQKKLFKHPVRGIFHVMVMYGFFVFLVHSGSQFIGAFTMDTMFYIPALFAHTVENIYDVSLDVFSILVFAGMMFFMFRRYFLQAPELDRPSFQSMVIILMLSLLMIFTLIGEPAKILMTGSYSWSPIRNTIADFYIILGWQSEAGLIYHIGWWGHVVFVLPFVFIYPRLKHAHLFWSVINYWNTSDKSRGEIKFLDIEKSTVWGAACVQEFSWKSYLEGLSCIECGRCTLVCPASRTGKVLNPKKIMTDLKHGMIDKMPKYINLKSNGISSEELAQNSELRILDSMTTRDEIWACTTCYSCVESCPVGNNQLGAIIEMRRSAVLNEGAMPSQLQGALTNIENQSNPWGISPEDREKWAEGLNVPVMREYAETGKNPEILYWVGCAGAFDDRNKKIARAFTKIMQKAKVDFAILGTEESCTGDTARRAGNEYLFQTLAAANIDLMNGYGIKKIVTACPHCFNTIKNEYPAFGGNYEVVHHSEFINELAATDRIKINSETSKSQVTYHDSCYLGRYNNNYNNPREVLQLSGKNIVDPDDSKDRAMCCGAGGVQMWMEEMGSERVNIARTHQLLKTGSKTLATACPFCVTMIGDAIKSEGLTGSHNVLDIAEVIVNEVV
jgi:Fe-S oxidoreductase